MNSKVECSAKNAEVSYRGLCQLQLEVCKLLCESIAFLTDLLLFLGDNRQHSPGLNHHGETLPSLPFALLLILT